ncbi:hypothetical protein D6C90_02334 [Aureobasidium pullulans]|uniref:Uncharacterized protein n=1 Tax=Aureobasidium pullulans TaxID=5580 RepID=A0A4S9VH06_AURPU|nr:hypothetical protein D6D22_06079 [Aureobasidium pullulans]THX74886.1 hypothetical protein D6D04_07690 [Aureobasidium pullulans]THZ50728.1 hypothetical protein D6C90_02334 [Aureobasidium pullulans]CAC9894574.1 unnamed protein product [Aureobasidium pullulans]
MFPTQDPPEQDLLDQLDCTRLSELQYLSTYCPFTLNAKCCPHGSKCLLKKVCYVLCAFRTTGSYCDGDHQVSAICQQFLTDKGCRYRKEDDHPFLGRSHDVELRRCMDVMLKPHQLGLYGVEHF